jgi:myo-inositol-1(or 4)-monophosphatase
MVEEAGGCVTAFDGSPCTIYDPQLLATNGKIHSKLMKLLKS